MTDWLDKEEKKGGRGTNFDLPGRESQLFLGKKGKT